MRHEVTSRPAGTAPEEAGGRGRRRPPSRPGRALALEGLVVYLVLQAAHGGVPAGAAVGQGELLRRRAARLLRPREARPGQAAARRVPAHLARQPVRRRAVPGQPPTRRAVPGQPARSGSCPPRPPWRSVAALHVALAGVVMWAYCRLALRTGWAGAALAGLGVRLRLGHPAAHHPAQPAPGDRLDAAGAAVRPPGPGAGPAALGGPDRGRGRAPAAGRPPRGMGLHPVRPGHLRARLDHGRRPARLAPPGPGRRPAARRGHGRPRAAVRLAAAARPCCCSARAGGPRPPSTSSTSCRPGWPSTPCCPTTATPCSARTSASSGWSPWGWPASGSGPARPGCSGCGAGRWPSRCSGS